MNHVLSVAVVKLRARVREITERLSRLENPPPVAKRKRKAAPIPGYEAVMRDIRRRRRHMNKGD